MAYENPVSTLVGALAAADLSAKQFFLMKMTSTGVNLAGDGEACVGVLQNKPNALNMPATVWGPGSVSKVVAGAAVAKGAAVASDAAGKAVTCASGEYQVGQALEAAAADGNLIAVFINPQGRLA